MRYALVQNGVVQNVIKATPEIAAQWGAIECPEHVGPGWLYDGQVWSEAAAVVVAQTEVESHKARIELIVRGEWAQILAIVDAMPEPQRSIATEALYGPHYKRTSPMLAILADAMGWSAADVDERFAAAAARVV